MRQRKIKLINDYQQFKYDIYMIQNELNDSEIIAPDNFPEVLADESIDVKTVCIQVYFFFLNCMIIINFML